MKSEAGVTFSVSIMKITRLSGHSGWIELYFVERERTPSGLTKLSILLHLAGLSLSNTIRELKNFGVKRSRKAVHDWVQEADLQVPRHRSQSLVPRSALTTD